MSGPGHPAVVEIVRGPMVESRHRVRYAVVDTAGKLVRRGGDAEAPVYPRSAVKPIQALAMVEAGAADAFELGAAEIALACGSHTGEPRHTAIVLDWLERIACGESDLACGTHPPLDGETALALAAAARAPGAVHNSCSGKHAGFLSLARHIGAPVRGYIGLEHPVQQRVLGILEQMYGLDLSGAERGIDGCGIPVFAVPLGNVALSMVRLADPADQPDARRDAAGRIRAAMAAEPFLVAGSGRFDTAVIAAFGGPVLVKSGAEGICCACLADSGLGIAVKAEDGAARAAQIVMAALLHGLADPSAEGAAALERWARPIHHNHAGTVIGQARVAAESNGNYILNSPNQENAAIGSAPQVRFVADIPTRLKRAIPGA